MNFLKKIKAFFMGNPEEKAKQEAELEARGVGKWDCKWCEQPIAEGEQRTFNGKKWHKKCCREMIKMARKEMGA